MQLKKWIEQQNEIIDQKIDDFIAKESFQPKASSPKRKKQYLKDRKQNIKDQLEMKPFKEDLKNAAKIIYRRLPDRIAPEEWEKVDSELKNIKKSIESFLQRHLKGEVKDIATQREIMGLSNETMIHIYDLGVGLFETEEPSKAKSIFTMLVLIAPEISSFWLGLGRSYQFNGEYVKALEVYGKGKRVEPEQGRFYLFSAECYDALDDPKPIKNEIAELKNNASKDPDFEQQWERIKELEECEE